ncbi:hypothetical protein H6G06_26530 [Anabaena sphaerica FACHB-251]|uniref:ATP synthase subunit B n=1 Tax=Anabaena sphaerica FACHB-251 TaxID=2692883 RepID=A0A926WM08_9NOST|nr:hypothetical protein [Anabaena sphaerica]MBD2296934.1 hypothetical protein [Anabaena sphaerica FACHB-251]
MFKKSTIVFTSSILYPLIWNLLVNKPAFSQSSQQNTNSDSQVNGDFNNVFQIPNQNNAQNSNINEFNFPNIYPLNHSINTPVNTENDFGFNMSVGVNTLDAANVTVYLGFIFQPGRTNSHKIRMQRIIKETELLETQKKIAEGQLQLIQKQITEAELRLQKLQYSSSPKE